MPTGQRRTRQPTRPAVVFRPRRRPTRRFRSAIITIPAVVILTLWLASHIHLGSAGLSQLIRLGVLCLGVVCIARILRKRRE